MFFFDYLLIFFGMLMIIIGLLLSVAYLTLLERKVLSYIQFRKGPNKIGLMGLFQPFSDGLKLFSKENIYPLMSNYFLYYFSPIVSFILSLMLWSLIPYYFNFISFELGIIYFISLISLGVYMMLIMGWSSNSNYSMLGSLRSVAQTISYEVSMTLIFMSNLILIMSLDFMLMKEYQSKIWMFFILMPLGMIFISSLMAETNRSPFDFAEGESELVSGFNVEYGGGGFALIFLSEYSMILMMSMIFNLIYLGGYDLSLFFYLKLMLISFIFIWVRGTLPRYRYDKLMYLCWKIYLPVSLNYLMMMIGLKIFLN